jgi:hypothetical protein
VTQQQDHYTRAAIPQESPAEASGTSCGSFWASCGSFWKKLRKLLGTLPKLLEKLLRATAVAAMQKVQKEMVTWKTGKLLGT